MFKNKWEYKRKRKILDDGVPATLKGVNIVDANEVAKIEWPKFDVPEVPQVFPEQKHPLWKDKPCAQFSSEMHLMEGEPQLQVLTKTLKREGLPPFISERIGQLLLPNQDELVEGSILHSHFYDSIQERKRRTLDPKNIHRLTPREYGIRTERKNYHLSMSLLRLCAALAGRYPQIFNSTAMYDINVSFPTTKDGDLLHFNARAASVLLADDPLPIVSDDVESTRDEQLPDLYPVKSTLDLKEINVYSTDDQYIMTHKQLHPHLVMIVNDAPLPMFKDHQLTASGIGSAFTFAASHARRLYGTDVKVLPTPLAVQCVIHDGRRFHFLYYQLNTLDLDGDDGIKNMVWMDTTNPLYDRYESVAYQPVLEGYNPRTMQTLLAMYSSPQKQL
jgi:large subunit ribosomal protein L37